MTSFVFICEKNTNALGITNICTNPIIEQLECVRDVTSDRQTAAGRWSTWNGGRMKELFTLVQRDTGSESRALFLHKRSPKQ